MKFFIIYLLAALSAHGQSTFDNDQVSLEAQLVSGNNLLIFKIRNETDSVLVIKDLLPVPYLDKSTYYLNLDMVHLRGTWMPNCPDNFQPFYFQRIYPGKNYYLVTALDSVPPLDTCCLSVWLTLQYVLFDPQYIIPEGYNARDFSEWMFRNRQVLYEAELEWNLPDGPVPASSVTLQTKSGRFGSHRFHHGKPAKTKKRFPFFY